MLKDLIVALSKLYYRKNKKRSKYIPAANSKLDSQDLEYMIKASLDMWLTEGKYNTEFERRLSEYVGVKHALTVNSGSSANLLALSSLFSHKLPNRLRPGDEVITVACGFTTTITPILILGLVPVFLDIDRHTFNLNTNQLEEALSPRSKVIFIANTLGNPNNWDVIKEFAKRHNLWVIADNCDSLSSQYDGKRCGSIGDINTFSFFPAHELTMGEGGAVATDHHVLYSIMRSIKSWGRDCRCVPGENDVCGRRFTQQFGKMPGGYDHKYIFSECGMNLKITEWQAAIGVSQLSKVERFSITRRNNFQILNTGLNQYRTYLTLPEALSIKSSPVWFGYPIIVKKNDLFDRAVLIKYLEAHRVGVRMVFGGNMLRQPLFTENDYPVRIRNSSVMFSSKLTEEQIKCLPESDYVMEHAFWVSCGHSLSKADVNHILDTFDNFFRELTTNAHN